MSTHPYHTAARVDQHRADLMAGAYRHRAVRAAGRTPARRTRHFPQRLTALWPSRRPVSAPARLTPAY